MTLKEIKQAIANGSTVIWGSPSYKVVLDSKNQYLIKSPNGHCIGLTQADDVTLNGYEKDFMLLTDCQQNN